MNSRDRELRVKQEGEPKLTTTRSARSQWSSSHKNPRIVRVSRTFGGKDRHSKVCTVRGLRDRRIRLSVHTAVQLYDLQEKLGLSQPSKVVDWLLEATKTDIDNLPPLPIIPGIFTQFPNPNQPSPPTTNPQSEFSKFDDERGEREREREKWIEQESHEGFGGFVAQNFFPLGNLNQPHFPFHHNPYFHWDHNPNLSLSQFGPNYINPLPNQGEDQSQNLNPSNSHLYFCPNAPTIPPFPSNLPPSMEQNLGFSTALHLMSSPMRPFASKPAQPHHNDAGGSEKEE